MLQLHDRVDVRRLASADLDAGWFSASDGSGIANAPNRVLAEAEGESFVLRLSPKG